MKSPLHNSQVCFALVLLVAIAASCTTPQPVSHYEQLKEYEGQYQYSDPDRLELAASDYDTTLYAIIDDARYPLVHVKADTFHDSGKNNIIFLRDDNGRVSGYQTDGQTFNKLSDSVAHQSWFPRQALQAHPERYQYTVPNASTDGLETGDAGIGFRNPELLTEMIRETIRGKYPDVHSILIWKDGKLVMEEYFYEYNADKLHQLRSASKSFIGTLVGIAIDQGKIKDEHERLLPYFDSEYPEILHRDARKEAITIKNFLTYLHGMDCNDENPESAGNETNMYPSPDWIKFTLDLPMIGEPGTNASYCSGCAQTLGRLVEITTKQPLVTFADKNLFKPLGISQYKWTFRPDPTNAATFNQLYLRPRDMLKLALMYKDNGQWNGQRIVSEAWIGKTFAKEDPEFGYLWRHKYYEVDGKRYNSYLATGNGGQKINIWPELNMVTVFTGGNYNSHLYGRQTPPNELIPRYILKAL